MLCSSPLYILVSCDNVNYRLEYDNPYVPYGLRENIYYPVVASRIDMPRDILDKAMLFENLKGPVKCLCLIDIFFSFYYFYMSWIIGMIFTFASVSGYSATIYNKKSLMTCYVGYQYFQVTGRALNLGYFIYLVSYSPTSISNNNYTYININTSVVKENYGFEIAILSIMFLGQAYIAKIVAQFYQLLPCDTDRQRVSYTLLD